MELDATVPEGTESDKAGHGAKVQASFVETSPYRPDIDGLRAVAVLLVVLFHARLPGLTGGFVGVDVFFVISGYLITQIIVSKADAGTFTYGGFYARRIRRLLPAYTVVALAILAGGFWISFPRELVDLGQSLVASGAFATNVLFWRESGYFAGPAEIKPMLHTWSLSVEEQFYLFFPLLILVLGRLGLVRRRVGVLVAILVISLIGSELALRLSPSASFYLLPSRGWELMIGAVLALRRHGLDWNRSVREGIAIAGLLLILASSLVLSGSSPFPGVAAVAPCLGTAVLINFGDRTGLVGGWLATAPMVLIGKISYSLYLWHWPLFAYARYLNVEELSPLQSVGVVVASFVLAYLTWRFVETPFRAPASTPRFKPLHAVVAVSLLSLATGAMLIATTGLPGRFDRATLALLAPERGSRHSQCMAGQERWIEPSHACLLPSGKGPGDVVVWGDSHAHAVVNLVAEVAGKSGSTVRFFGYSGCPPVPGIRRIGAGALSRCSEFNARVRELVMESRDIRTVVLVARHAVYLEGFTGEFGPAEGQGGVQIETVDGFGDLHAAYFAGLDRLVADLEGAGKSVVLFYPVPEVAYDVPTTLAMISRFGGDPDRFVRPVGVYWQRQGSIRRELDLIAKRRHARIIDPFDEFCDAIRCVVAKDGLPLYSDSNHLSEAGAALLRADVESALGPPR